MLPRLWHTLDTSGLRSLSDVENLFDAFETLSKQHQEQLPARTAAPTPVALDIYEHEDRFECWLDLPGVAREDVKVSLENDTLKIQGERPAQAETEQTTRYFRRAERWTGSFARSITLPSTVDGSRIEAQLKDGVLKLVLPKRDQAKPRSIQING